jgi:hypothetical protein
VLRATQADEGSDAKGRYRDEVEHDLCHHAERPLAAGHDLGKVVPDVVLHEPRQAGRDGAVREHGFNSTEAGAHRAVPDDVDAAGVGGDHAAESR